MNEVERGEDFIKFEFSDDEETEELKEEIEEELQEELDAANVDKFLSVDTLTPLPIPPWTPPAKVYSKNFIALYFS